MKLLATADVHANKARAKSVVKLINNMKEIAIKEKVSAVLFCGDFFDSAMTNTKASGFVDVLKAMNSLCSSVKVIMIEGTPSHEALGSLHVFAALGATVIEKPRTIHIEDKVILAIPEPRRSDFIRKSSKETSDAINEALSEVCSVKADLIMFHGEISGASMQNGMKASSDVQLSKDMIARTESKITLCGHIHTTEEVYKNIVYCGSPIPCNYGETHSPSLVLVNLEDKATFKRIPTGFPTMKTVEANKDLFAKMSKLNFSNCNVKIKLSLSAEERKLFNPLKEASKLKEATGANDISITVIAKKETTVRAKEIVQKTSMSDKLDIYGEVNNIKITDSIKAKAKEVEDNLFIKYNFPSHNFELLSLSLRGAIGVKFREQIDIDFRSYEQGILGLCGENGTGKSTTIENCHPYPRLLTRSGALKNHFYLKDSHRIVTYSDENGKLYRFTIQIAAHTQNGIAKYFAETSDDNGDTWKSVPECDGNLDTYTKYVEDTFGSIEIYLRTAFFAKEQVKGIPDIASATKGARIKLFSELIGTDNISTMHDIVKDNMKSIESEMKQFDNCEEKLSEINESLEKKNDSKNFLDQALKDCVKSLEKSEIELKDKQKKQREFEVNYGSFSSAIEIRNKCIENIAEYKNEIKELEDLKSRNDIFINHKKQITEYKSAKEDFVSTEKELRLFQPKVMIVIDEESELKSKYNELNSEFTIEQNKLEKIEMKIDKEKSVSFEVSDNCPTCGAKLSQKRKAELYTLQHNCKQELEAMIEYRDQLRTSISSLKKKTEKAKVDMNTKSSEVKKLREELKVMEDKYSSTQFYLDANSEYDGFDDYSEIPSERINSELSKYSTLLKNQEALYKDLENVEYIDYSEEISNLENRIKNLTEERVELSTKLGSINTEISQIIELRDELTNETGKVKQLAHEYEEYSILETAYSNGGIMALELEAAAPDIASLTNKILEESYGDKFHVSFTTLHQGRGKLVDDFSIDVTNTETGRTAPIEYLSSGEKVWIMQSLYYAFSIVRMEKTGFSFLVRFIDESDGSLDSEARLRYLNMVSSAHKNGQNRLTVLITHSSELKELLTQTIQL